MQYKNKEWSRNKVESSCVKMWNITPARKVRDALEEIHLWNCITEYLT